MNPAEKAIRSEIDRREQEIASLQKALAALTGASVKAARDTSGGGSSSAGRKGTRKPKTAAQKKAISRALKAAWKRRKTSGGKTPAEKSE